jgi:tetraacyldisaccharide 4'-kinase
MKKTISRWLQDAWYKEMYISTWLVPLSMIYHDIVRLRRSLYRNGVLKTTRLPVPVVIVGNITVGGTGKTPLLIWMANFLQQEGFRPGIISRGYAAESNEKPRRVLPDSLASEVGDEPVLIALHTHCPLVVCRNRSVAGKMLLSHFDCNVILSDDGLQHYALERDIEIAVIDGQRRFGNGYCLPAGPLRESVDRLTEVDLVIVNGQPEQSNEKSMALVPADAINLSSGENRPLSSFAGQPCHALAGIGNPDRFFNLLQDLGLDITAHAFPDHHDFQREEINFADRRPVLMTEKDAVKCREIADHQHWFVPVTAQPDNVFTEQFLTLLNSKYHGHKIT